MASDLQGRIDAAIQRRIDAAIERKKKAADPVSQAVEKVAGQQGDDDLAYRGQLLPLGRTKEGNIVPALPQAFQDAAQMTKSAVETGQMPTPGEALSTGLAFSPAGVASRGASKSLIPGADKNMPRIMTAEELNVAKREAYKASEEAGYRVEPKTFEAMVIALGPEVRKIGYDVGLTPNASKMLVRLAGEVAGGGSKSLQNLDTLRQLARSAANDSKPGGKDEAVNNLIKDRIDEFIEAQTGGNSGLKIARELALRASKAEEIDDIMEQAITKSGEYRASGIENAWRAKFAILANNKKKMARYTKEEQDAIKEAGRTETAGQKGLITLGKFSPTAGAIGMFLLAAATGEGAGHLSTFMAHPELLALPAGGLVARYAATKMREKSVDVLQQLVKGGKPMSDYRVQQAMKGRSMGSDLQRAGLLGAGGMMPAGQPQQPEFNPLINPNQL